MEAAQGMDHGFNGLRENLGAARDKDPPAIEVGEAKITANVRRSPVQKGRGTAPLRFGDDDNTASCSEVKIIL